MKKFLLSALVLAGFGLTSAAQTAGDIFRYSQRSHSGTARSVGLAGAQSSLGADFGSLSYNPAGIGLYRQSEFTVTPNLNYVSADSKWFDGGATGKEDRFALSNVGLVLNSRPISRKKRENGWKFTNFGIGYNRVYNYNREVVADGFNDAHSITDFFAENANGQSEGDLNTYSNPDYGALAYRAYLIDPTDLEGSYVSVLSGGGVNQREVTSDIGSKNELLINYGMNYQDKYFFGFALGIPILENTHRVVFSENDDADNYSNFNSLSLEEEVITSGSGINLSIGTIIRLTDQMRFGLSVKTPSLYSITETYERSLSATTLGAGELLEGFDESTEGGLFEYRFTEPMRFNTGLSYFFTSRGMLSFDYEFVDYGASKVFIDESEYSAFETALNESVESSYKGTHALKIAGELKFSNEFYARGGVALTSSPYASESLDGSSSRLGLGLGYRNEKFFLDLGFANQKQATSQQPYQLAETNVPFVDTELSETNMMITFGKRF